MGFLTGIKDKTTAMGLKKYLNSNYGQYGEIRDLSIDTSSRTISIDAQLKGESDAFKLKLINYDIIEKSDGAYIKFSDVITSREWINLVIKNLVPSGIKDNGIKLPKEYEGMIKSIL
ncbi:MAG TPA: hypothetical protein VHO28_06655 [Ignavibacteriales bacterium]|nr:hypothetical protein [Ignavibacteriales bacterium]